MKNKEFSFIEREIKWLLEEKYSNQQTSSFFQDVERLKKGEPIEYLIGFSEFLSCKIDLSLKPFIPRLETEYWVEEAIREIKKTVRGNKRVKALDVFAGSGCIGIAILKHIPFARCDFIEKEKRFLQQIKINLRINKIKKKRYQIFNSDIFEKIDERKKYNFILANPPYISFKRKAKVQKSVLKYEPQEAIFATENGLFYIKRFLEKAKNHLEKGGKIFLEFDSFQKSILTDFFKKYKYNFEFRRDQYHRWRWVVLS